MGVLLLVHSTVCGEAETVDALREGGLEAEVVYRHLGNLGPRISECELWLRQRGMLHGETDEVVVVRAEK